MRIRTVLAVAAGCLVVEASADTIRPKSGEPVQGVIQKMENGRVTIQIDGQAGGGVKVLSLADIEAIDFDTPHLTEATGTLPLDHFLRDYDAQEMVRLGRNLKQLRKEVETQLASIQKSWQSRQPIDKDQARQWEAAKETFQAPMRQYQETVRDLYLHVLARVEDYNKLAGAADKIYVGVKGPFNAGSPLLSSELHEVTARQVVPRNWYDRIFFEGYTRGYKEGSAFERLSVIPPAQGNGAR